MPLQEYEIQFESITVHYWQGGQGFPLLMLHGSGPGASTLGNWRLVLDRLVERHHVLAVDLIGFGKSGRKSSEPYFDLDLWLRQARHMLRLLPGESVGVIAHSLSAVLALKLAGAERRVRKVLTTGAMGGAFKLNCYLDWTWSFPAGREELRRTTEALVYDKSLITEAFLDSRMQVLQAPGYSEYFRAMFTGDKQRYIDQAVMSPDQLRRLDCDFVMMHGREDLPIPAADNSLTLGGMLPRADIMIVGRCGHSPALEHPDKLLACAAMLFG
jgi:2-hydroxymuconate-semialdehyde hydrolase